MRFSGKQLDGFSITRMLLCLVFGGLLSWFCFWISALDWEQQGTWVWVIIITSSMLGGYWNAWVKQNIDVIEILLAVAIAECLAAAIFGWFLGFSDITSFQMRILLVAPPILVLAIYFGASWGFLSSAGQGKKPEWNMGYEFLVGKRFLLEKSSSELSMVTTLSLFGVALGVSLVITTMAVLGGFEDDLQQKIIGANAHVVVQQSNGKPFETSEAMETQLAEIPGVNAIAAYLEGEVALASQSNFSEGVLFGVNPERSVQVLGVLKQIVHGSLNPIVDDMRPKPPRPKQTEEEFLAPASVPFIVMGREMSKELNVGVGDRVRLISPVLQEMTPLGMAPRSLDFEVAAIFSTDMYEFDARFLYAALPSVRRFMQINQTQIHGYQMATRNPEAAPTVAKIAKQVLQNLDAAKIWDAVDWKTRNQTLFAALELEKVVAFIVLVFVILVASFSIVSTLTMSVIEKQKEIAILKTMGGRDASIMKVFLVQGVWVGSFGTLVGGVLGVGIAMFFKQLKFGIPGEVYYIDSLPVHVGVGDVVLVVLAALMIVWDFSVFPAIQGAELTPVEGLRDG